MDGRYTVDTYLNHTEGIGPNTVFPPLRPEFNKTRNSNNTRNISQKIIILIRPYCITLIRP